MQIEMKCYKSICVMETNDVTETEIKNLLRMKYFRRLRLVLPSKLTGYNEIQEVNMWAIASLRYRAEIIKRQNELRKWIASPEKC